MDISEMFRLLLNVFAVLRVVAGDNITATISIATSPSNSYIFLGEKTSVNMTIHFPSRVHRGIKVDVFPTMDVPDFVITKVTQVKIGSNLRISGSTTPVMDYGIKSLQVPGKALSCQFNFGDVKKIGKSARRENDVIFIQYEAMVPLNHDESVVVGHKHLLGLHLKEDELFITTCQHEAMFTTRSMPLLFQALDRSRMLKDQTVKEMSIKKSKLQDIWEY